MAVLFHFHAHVLVLTATVLFQIPSSSSSIIGHALTRGSSLSVGNNDDILVSPDSMFTAGFHQVGENAYGFAVWFSEQATSWTRTVIWMANRDAPVNGKYSKLSISEDGNLVLIDADEFVIWSTQTKSNSSLLQLQLQTNGNLVLHGGGQPLWQSFDYPTDTLLPSQFFTKNTQLVSSRSSTNYSSGFYKLFFDNDSILRLLYDGPETTTVFWPHPSFRPAKVGRFLYRDSRRASLDSDGQFNSSDGFSFISADFKMGRQRLMRIDTDGNVRVYSLVGKRWEVQYQVLSNPCQIHGICGPNSLCTYSPALGRECACLHGYKIVNAEDWSYGCEPEFQPCMQDDCDFIELRHVEFYGYDVRLLINRTTDACKNDCLQDNTCMGFQFGVRDDVGAHFCYLKTSLRNGYQMGIDYLMYIKLPKRFVSSFNQKTKSESSFSCPHPVVVPIIRSYEKKHDMKPLRLMLVFVCTIAFFEIVCLVLFCYYSRKHSPTTEQRYFLAATPFRKFTYSELKKASGNFSDEIGKGGASIVYKGKLADNRIAAIKRLTNTNHQGEAEFHAEMSTIGRVNHMNLIETWGYCAEGKHRLVVYEFMKNGSLAENLGLGKLDWATRLHIAKGIAKGLAYLHEECLEWVLHCDVKPQNILLDANYNPKVADFGLSKLLDRTGINQWNFSMIRGTRGYMAPEWVLNLPITSKVDVFSYGVVILEMVTGRSAAGMHQPSNENGEPYRAALVNWVRDKSQELDESQTESWVDGIVDPSIRDQCNHTIMQNLVRVALECAAEDGEARPSMSQVVDMLLEM
ncbi:hypothetical protein L2E82_01446 [Cichorium intybus]|uniref:Uncharacterized protein n=1 Tax=Cichorium intybus TaxID=13427 RepID=A0ACB9H014_CICIN|nr:hypothetical protein L2E82_01446 [Cichorium intybus]